jgi:hypothetical protein
MLRANWVVVSMVRLISSIGAKHQGKVWMQDNQLYPLKQGQYHHQY